MNIILWILQVLLAALFLFHFVVTTFVASMRWKVKPLAARQPAGVQP